MKTITLSIAFILILITPRIQAQSSLCVDLAGLNFGECLAVLGYGMVNGECTAISGCSTVIDNMDYGDYFFDTPEQCEAYCTMSCIDFQFLDFGPCEAIIGYGMVNGECSAISGCSTTINGFDFAPYLYSSPEACGISCDPICMDLYGIDFGPCDLFMGYAWINGEVIPLSGCGSIVDGTDYSAFIYESEDACEQHCENACLDLATLDFGLCTTPLGITIINGECTMVSGCSYEVNGVDYEDYFYSSMEDCEATCIAVDTLCVIPEIIDSTSACYEIYAPVCGCDGVSYSNDCYARSYGGVLYWTEGTCTTGINEVNYTKVRFYPNPANNLLTIENPEFEEFTIQIIDITGKQILSTYCNSSKTIDISYIKQGIYLLYIREENNTVSIMKLIVN